MNTDKMITEATADRHEAIGLVVACPNQTVGTIQNVEIVKGIPHALILSLVPMSEVYSVQVNGFGKPTTLSEKPISNRYGCEPENWIIAEQ